jgi:hypothetical protein
MPITIPPDLATNTEDALRYHGGSPVAAAFVALVATGVRWRPSRVRELIAWAEKRRVLVDGTRHLIAMLAGFGGAGWRARMRSAILTLRAAAVDVAEGREGEAFTAEGVIPITDGPTVNWGRAVGCLRSHEPYGPNQRPGAVSLARRWHGPATASTDTHRAGAFASSTIAAANAGSAAVTGTRWVGYAVTA